MALRQLVNFMFWFCCFWNMSDYFRIHIPILAELSAAAAGPIVVKHGRGRLPYDVYLRCIELYALLRGSGDYDARHWFSNTWLYKTITSKQHATAIKVFCDTLSLTSAGHNHHTFIFSTADVISLCDHAVVTQVKLITSLIQRLCDCTDETQAVIACIHRLAMRIHDKNQRITVLSCGLAACPIKPIRDTLLLYGAHLNPLDRDYLHHAAGNGMIDIVQAALDSGAVPNRYDLSSYAMKSGYINMVNLVCKAQLSAHAVGSALSRNHFALCELPICANAVKNAKDFRSQLWEHVHSVEAAQWLIQYQRPLPGSVQSIALNHRLDVIQYLVETAHVTLGLGIVDYVMMDYADLGFIDYLLEHGADINGTDEFGFGALQPIHMPLYRRYFIDKGIKKIKTVRFKPGDYR